MLGGRSPGACDCGAMNRLKAGLTSVLAVCLMLRLCSAYYLPGTYPQEFFKGDQIQGELVPTRLLGPSDARCCDCVGCRM